ncbi:zinc finger protein ZAT3-like [Trifolium pratense]|uniref:zinc finger protein ZAT3-like n=1 Tax=Trifolium pratense TaxID=57577 RepID=UPI001E6924CF|nr:zinc finger protein ZAT3-like [Trifolium pratense]
MKSEDNSSDHSDDSSSQKKKDHQQHNRPCSSSLSGKKRKHEAESSSANNNNNNNNACTECGKKFWSSKALFGHMRCHPEREWRGINPPPNFRRRQQQQQQHTQSASSSHSFVNTMTPNDHEVASCLIFLANSKPRGVDDVVDHHHHQDNNGHFVCSCCNKVFGSHQALGGHRASHKNVKGCFANTTPITASTITASSSHHHHHEQQQHHNQMMVPRDGYNAGDVEGEAVNEISCGGGGHHQCSICFRVFSTGQALGGHKRCHWEKGETSGVVAAAAALDSAATTSNNNKSSSSVNVVDLNFPLPPPPPPPDDNDDPDDSSLDLRLGL